MRPGREIDTRIAREVFGYSVWAKNKTIYEGAPKGERPLRAYSNDIQWAWEVADKLKIAFIPVVGGQWFVFVPPQDSGWESPQAMLKFLDEGNFNDCAAALGDSIPLLICQAALKAMDKRAIDVDVVNPIQFDQDARQ
ncbi:MAG: hypothetical protein NDI61_11055 [Bdellovibrionaceae bacterium]|nr:hypothetical protein [Pseudobdellovibrionaceae bacterium]